MEIERLKAQLEAKEFMIETLKEIIDILKTQLSKNSNPFLGIDMNKYKPYFGDYHIGTPTIHHQDIPVIVDNHGTTNVKYNGTTIVSNSLDPYWKKNP